MMTTVFNGIENAPTDDSELNDLLSDIRIDTKLNWQVETRQILLKKRWFGPNVYQSHYTLLLKSGEGSFPWQIIVSACGNAKVIKAYLIGYLSGMENDPIHTTGDFPYDQ